MQDIVFALIAIIVVVIAHFMLIVNLKHINKKAKERSKEFEKLIADRRSKSFHDFIEASNEIFKKDK